jgi:NADPH:quinone reductase-like Zn-dependent oxidoreductase
MKAVVCHRYGSPDALEIQDIDTPVVPDNGVLVRVRAFSVNTADLFPLTRMASIARLLSGPRTPRRDILGRDFAGTVQSVGKNVTQFQSGDDVFGTRLGAFAEYVCVPADGALVRKPANVPFEQAAAVPVAALTALQGLRDKGQIQPGQQVLIQGASGGVGTFAVQLAKALGANVTAVCSTPNVEMARAIGADQVIDYTQEDFTKRRRKNRQRYNLILGVNGYHPIWAYRRALRPRGRYLMVGAAKSHIFPALLQALLLGPVLSRMAKKKLGFMGIAKINQKDLAFLSELLAAGKVVPVLERRYPFGETAQAIRYLAQGHARGKIVISVSDADHTEPEEPSQTVRVQLDYALAAACLESRI